MIFVYTFIIIVIGFSFIASFVKLKEAKKFEEAKKAKIELDLSIYETERYIEMLSKKFKWTERDDSNSDKVVLRGLYEMNGNPITYDGKIEVERVNNRIPKILVWHKTDFYGRPTIEINTTISEDCKLHMAAMGLTYMFGGPLD